MLNPRYFTHYWRNQTINAYRDAGDEGKLLDFVVSNLFQSRGVKASDHIYVISVFDGVLFLVGKLSASQVYDREEAAKAMLMSPDDLYDGEDIILAVAATPKNYQLAVPVTMTERLQFVKPTGDLLSPTFVGPGCLDSQTLRGVRELSPASAALLDQLLPPLQPLERPERRDDNLLPDQVDTPSFREGAIARVVVNAYERNTKARAACIAHYGYDCAVCGYSLQDLYGSLGYNYIHVHHLKPLSEIGEEYDIDPVADLRPVCPNCHAMLHRQEPPLSIEQLKEHVVFEKSTVLSDDDYLDDEEDEEESVSDTDQAVHRYVTEHHVTPARHQRLKEIVFTSEQIHKEMGLRDQIRDVCRALDSLNWQVAAGVTLVERHGRPLGANARWCFTINEPKVDEDVLNEIEPACA